VKGLLRAGYCVRSNKLPAAAIELGKLGLLERQFRRGHWAGSRADKDFSTLMC